MDSYRVERDSQCDKNLFDTILISHTLSEIPPVAFTNYSNITRRGKNIYL